MEPKTILMLAVGLTAGLNPSEEPDAYEAARTQVRAATALQVESLDAWCEEVGLGKERDRLEQVLVGLERSAGSKSRLRMIAATSVTRST